MKRTIEGITLESQGTDDKQWHGTLDGEAWVFLSVPRTAGGTFWQGFTPDHLTGTPLHMRLQDAVAWVLAHRLEIEAKLLVRRAAGTRMVDPT